MRIKSISLAAALILLLSGCARTGTGVQNPGATTTTQTTGQTTAQATTQTTTQTTTPATTSDVVSSASIVDNAAAFEKAISNTGTWIIAITKDVTIDKDIVLDGEFKNGKKDTAGKDIIQRKVALYAQDANRNITARYTLTAPKFTINSPEASIQHGTFKGDLYVSAKDFQLKDATVDGNVYFTTDDAKSTFTMDQTSKITGKQEMKK
ncbi:MAG TPA: hypothetical protein VHT96_07650 [Clostridia bacterium]|nr:hypothetical protein [Clostridia bacterium]